ncbi:MAG: hypothetical protein M3068_02430 [Gemmatimonadota bacterium]|nr:hypothetical protein [Gemmatimonadota bacterium]
MSRPARHSRAVIAMFGIATLLLTAGPAQPAQKVWQADVRVQSLDVTALKGKGGPLSARIVVTSDNDEEARGTRLEILLPIGVGVLHLPAGCRPSPSAIAGLIARVSCDLGDIPVRGLREVSITTTGGAVIHGRFAAFVTSDTPDPQPSNNYAERPIP